MQGFGVFKGVHNGQGIYFARGAYNLDGSGYYRTMSEARAAIDAHCAKAEADEHDSRAAKAASGKCIVYRRNGDDVEITVPGEPSTVVSVRVARQMVFDLESRHGAEVVWV